MLRTGRRMSKDDSFSPPAAAIIRSHSINSIIANASIYSRSDNKNSHRRFEHAYTHGNNRMKAKRKLIYDDPRLNVKLDATEFI